MRVMNDILDAWALAVASVLAMLSLALQQVLSEVDLPVMPVVADSAVRLVVPYAPLLFMAIVCVLLIVTLKGWHRIIGVSGLVYLAVLLVGIALTNGSGTFVGLPRQFLAVAWICMPLALMLVCAIGIAVALDAIKGHRRAQGSRELDRS